ncbi:23S rRNA pseudouridine1911/1915/1917 synthase [Pseudobutyrivibrio sp. YE44]|uniref:RluA family pseudouridine synthase n=1 Tax=Pseudobutyrivibrio sp. YE44 TaxID=1520802 RepID=UPI000887B4E5|nr:RluA family pseudouridine synthase [Pseudobutyrivibrio sp. YE44]SDB30045.1 23S rRNA pseudouridine1911/1915/1917 synthase [Pseudobutyrivibrio sp. YE44]
MNRTLTYTIENEYNGITIDKYLKKKGYSSANITALKKMPNNVMIDDEWVHMNRKLCTGEELVVNISEDESSEKIPPVEMPLDIVYEDGDIIVVNKPAGLSIHPSLNHYEDSLANGLAYYYENQGKPFIFRCANRLDKNTSGLTVIAKHLVSGSILSTAVKNREFHREYYAIVRGTLTDKIGTIDAPIGRVPGDTIARQVDLENGERAITHYQVIEEKNGHSLVSIHLETGRTHQIRVHFKYIGHPLIGDDIYNPDFEYMKRHALHSHKISFKHPITGEELEFIAPLPDDMSSVLNN